VARGLWLKTVLPPIHWRNARVNNHPTISRAPRDIGRQKGENNLKFYEETS